MWYVIESKLDTEIPEFPLGFKDVYNLSLKKGKWETIGSYSSLSKANALYDAQEAETWIEDGRLKARIYMITDSENKKDAEIMSWSAVGE